MNIFTRVRFLNVCSHLAYRNTSLFLDFFQEKISKQKTKKKNKDPTEILIKRGSKFG